MAGQSNAPDSLVSRASTFARDIKLSHTLFALPFALLGMVLGMVQTGTFFSYGKIGLILICMFTARTLAMAANRLLDARLDALNPRTAGRAIPSGRLTGIFYLLVALICAVVFVSVTFLFARWYSNPWPLRLSLPVMAFITAYPLLKRFTSLCHFYLGVALGLAPLCACLAVTATITGSVLWISAAVVFWTAGFDIIYACQDFQSDRQIGIFSIPSRLGVAPALWLARLSHTLCLLALAAAGLYSPLLGPLWFTGLSITAGLLTIEHLIIRPTDLSRINVSFFTINSIISLSLAVMGIMDSYIH